MVKENFTIAANLSGAVGYEVVKFTDTDNSVIHYIARKSANSNNWWGTYFFNPSDFIIIKISTTLIVKIIKLIN